MKSWLKSAAAIMFAAFSAAAVAQTSTTPNLIGNQIGSGSGQWQGIGGYSQLNGAMPGDLWGCCTSYSGAAPFLDTSTGSPNGQSGQIHWSYGLSTVRQTIAINQALSGTGIQVNGYNWGYEVRNMNGTGGQGGVDSLTATTFITNTAGSRILTDTRTYNTATEWNWHGGTVTAPSPLLATTLGNLGIEFTASDSGFWAGYYGPQVRNVSLNLNYSVDQCAVNPQSSPTCPGYKTYYNMWDDGYAQVNLPFNFPFYGNTYTTSYMFTNGVIGFLNTNLHGYCCDGVDLNQQRFAGSTSWNFGIYALNTDLDVGPNSQFYTQQTDNGTGLKYTWDRVVEIGTNNENTFSVNIKDSGYIGINYQQVNLSPWRNPLIGIAGDVSQGQYSQYYFGPASNLPNMAGTTLQYSGTETTDACAANPLVNPSCPGYQQAYFNQQCSINALYDTTCPGYAAAYLTYQCNISQLYSPSCPGYQQAYLTQQCAISPLFSSSCSGYQTASAECAASPLYASFCPGYNVAVSECSTNGLLYTYCPTYQTELNYCSTDPLFNNLCPTYQTATASCSANTLNHSYCPGYQTALNTCSSNPLSNSLCSGYTAASTACSANQLTYTYCPSYTTAIAACSTNPQGNTMCPGYSSVASGGSGSTPTASTSEPAVQLASDGKVSTEVALVADSSVNAVITERATSSAPSPTATVNLAPQPAAAVEPIKTVAVEEKKEEKKEDAKTADSSSSEEKKEDAKSADSSSSSTATASSSDSKKEQPKTMRQQIQEQRVAAARAKAVEAGKELANKMGEAASLEAQVAVQNVVIQAMGFTPGFDTYNRAVLPDAQGYRPFEIYPGQRVIDNPQGRRFMTGSDRLHADMVDQQYNRSE